MKADAFWVRTESNAVRTQGAGRLAAARADATRLRAVLDGKRTFALDKGPDARAVAGAGAAP